MDNVPVITSQQLNSQKGHGRGKPKSQKWKKPACLRMASPVTVTVESFIPCSQESQQDSACEHKGKSGGSNEERDGFMLYVYYVFHAGIHLGASSKQLWSLWLKVEGVDPRSRTNELEEAAKLRPR